MNKASISAGSNVEITPLKKAGIIGMEEEEEMTTTDDERDSAIRSGKKLEENTEVLNDRIIDEKNKNEEEDEEQEEEDEEVEESSEDEEPPEMLALTRSKRSNAGGKMAELMKLQIAEKDDFYTNAYGGFDEGEQDDDFESPPHTSDEEVDSDFDKPEEEEDDTTAQIEERQEDVERRKKNLKRKRLLEQNKNWAIARINKQAVPENSCDPKTQQQRLEEAKKTEKLNIASLKRFEDLELERKKRQLKPVQRRKLEGPRVKELWTADGRHLITFPELPPKEQVFPRPERRKYNVCAVTGRPARYIDPITRHPYADIEAFRTLRIKYKELLEREQQEKQAGSRAQPFSATNGDGNNLSPHPTPAKQRKITI